MKGVLSEIARDQAGRLTMAANARQIAAQWTTEANIWRWLDAWHSR
jgi:hypothetical protein